MGDCRAKVVGCRLKIFRRERRGEFSDGWVAGFECDVCEVVCSAVDRCSEFWFGAVRPSVQCRLDLGSGDVGFDISGSLTKSFDVSPGHLVPIGVVGGQRVELADLSAEWFEVVFEASDLVDRVVRCDSSVEFGECAFFGRVDARAPYFVEERLGSLWERLRPVAERAGGVDDGGEFVVFDDVGPVLEDPVAAFSLLCPCELEGVDLVSDVDVG